VEATIVLMLVFVVVLEVFCGGSRGSSDPAIGRGDRMYDHCGATNYIEPYCWVKYGKPDYVHQVIDGVNDGTAESLLN
jgi:hypothetical protein